MRIPEQHTAWRASLGASLSYQQTQVGAACSEVLGHELNSTDKP